jgi:hypothetical protein
MQNGAARRKDMAADSSVSIRPRLPKDHAGTLEFNFVAPYFISPHDHNTLYHGGNYVFKSTDRGDNWEVISEDLSISSDPAKKSVAAGALAESKVMKGLLYMGTDKGAFWTSKDDGKNWEEHSSGLPNNNIRSIMPSQFKASRVYVALTGLNYDDLNTYLYVSEDYGANWKPLMNNLPNEVANVILEDPINENILYAGLYRGVYISIDRGNSWSLLGKNLPAVAIGDLEINLKSMDLVVATHGRGIYKVNLKPIHEGLDVKNEVFLFDLPTFTRPKFGDTHRQPDYETLAKSTISFYLPEASKMSLMIENTKTDIIWTKQLEGKKGINQYRWDLILQSVESDLPYFINFDQFIPKGKYTLLFTTGGKTIRQSFEVNNYK